MLIGLTYDIKIDYLAQGYSQEETAELDRVETVEAIEESLNQLGYETLCIGNIRRLISFLAEEKSCDMIFNIAEGLHGLCREAQIPALLDAYRIPYTFSEAHVLTLALHKGYTKTILKAAGIPTPAYRILSHSQEAREIDLPFPLFAKPAGGGTGMGIGSQSIIHSKKGLEDAVSSLLDSFSQPVLVETYLPGREFTAGITGTGEKAVCTGVMEILIDQESDEGLYSYATKTNYLKWTEYRKPEASVDRICSEMALKIWSLMGCRDAGRVDFRMDDQGRLNFLEINPLAGLNREDSDLPILCRMNGLNYLGLIKRIMDSAEERIFNIQKN